jgi:hypothetical protein
VEVLLYVLNSEVLIESFFALPGLAVG